MPGTLPPILPGSGSASGGPPMTSVGGWNRAQSFGSSKRQLKQYRDREQATVSINQVVSGSKGNQKSTSVFHPGGASQGGTTSIAHAGEEAKRSIYDGVEDTKAQEEARSNRRYKYMRKLMKGRQKAEAAALKEAAKKAGLKVGTGSSFRKKMLTKKLRKMVYKDPAKYKNISKEDRKFFEKVVGKYAKGMSAGSGYGPTTKKRMRLEIARARRAGKITHEDQKDFTDLINKIQ